MKESIVNAKACCEESIGIDVMVGRGMPSFEEGSPVFVMDDHPTLDTSSSRIVGRSKVYLSSDIIIRGEPDASRSVVRRPSVWKMCLSVIRHPRDGTECCVNTSD